MARIAVFSDTHGRIDNLALFRERFGQVDSVFHLGDCVEDAPELAARLNSGYVSVRGNCDPWAQQPLQQIISWHGHRILLLHGHLYTGRLALWYKAKQENCDIVCSGHTHIGSVELYDGIRMLNPGSLSRPRDGKGPSCMLLTLEPEAVHAALWHAGN